MKKRSLLLFAVMLVGLGLAAWVVLAMALVGSTLEPAQLEAVSMLLAPRLVLVVMSWLIALLLVAVVLNELVRRYVTEPARLLEQSRVLLAAASRQQITPAGAPVFRGLAEVLNTLAAERESLREDMVKRIEAASRSVQEEKDRLAALMSELTQSVVVCNLDGRIVLYNNHARAQFQSFSNVPELASGVELIGIGRSIYAVFERQLVVHALEIIDQRLARGDTSPSAQFVTSTHSGQLLRVQIAPILSAESRSETAPYLSGFVLMLDNVTRSLEEATQRDQLLHGLTERSRSSLANMQAAIDMLSYPDLEAGMRERFLGVVREEVLAMSQRITELATRTAQGLKTRWPLEEILGTDLLTAAQRRIDAQCDRPTALEVLDDSIWLRVDSFSLLQALSYLARRLVDEFEVKYFQLRLQAAEGRAQLDLVWSGHAMSTETVMSWEMEPMQLGTESMPLTVRDVVDRHGGEVWFERDRVRHQAFFRFLLPLASEVQQLSATRMLHSDSRPEFYDFDLFQITEESRALDERPLSTLAFTVFDTETTGLNPSHGDEIIQIGAVRIFNGKLLKQECFDQLVDPGRMIPAASVKIHGITQDMVKGKHLIGEVLPAFHAFAHDTVLVAHNAAFDMRFLQLKEAATGLVFHQPVLDTLLLSAVLHPHQDSHQLEVIASRFNITVMGRHTALGDAMVTAEVLLRLIPLLEGMGIKTLKQAREAAQSTYLARLKY